MRIRYTLLAVLLAASTISTRAQTALTKLGSTSTYATGTALAVDGNIAYVLTAKAGESQLIAYDVSNPASPRGLCFVPLPTPYNTPVPFWHAAVSNGILYISSYPTSAIFPNSPVVLALDVHNPAVPTLLGYVLSIGSPQTLLAASGNYLYAVGSSSTTLRVHDSKSVTSNYLNSTTVELPYSLSGILSLSISGNTLYVQYGNGVFATLDITNPAAPVSSAGTMPGTISAVSGTMAYGLAQPAYAGSVPGNTLRFYSLANPLQPTLTREMPGSYGTLVAAAGQSVFTVGETSPYIPAVASSREPLRGYFMTSASAAPLEAVASGIQGANALAVANNKAYVLTDNELSIYTFPSIVTATRSAATLAPLALYPNPASGTVHITQPAADGNVAVYDATGRLCLQTKLPASGTLDVSALPVGLYQVRTGTASGKLTIQ